MHMSSKQTAHNRMSPGALLRGVVLLLMNFVLPVAPESLMGRYLSAIQSRFMLDSKKGENTLPRFSKSSNFDTMEPEAYSDKDDDSPMEGNVGDHQENAAWRGSQQRGTQSNSGFHKNPQPVFWPGHGAGMSSTSGTCAVVFRTWGNPGPELMARVERWSQSLDLLRETDSCDVWISIDETREQVDRQKYNILPGARGSVSQQAFHPVSNATEDANSNSAGGMSNSNIGMSKDSALSGGESSAGADMDSRGAGADVDSDSADISAQGMSMAAAHKKEEDSLGSTLEAAANKMAKALGTNTGVNLEGDTGATYSSERRRKSRIPRTDSWFMHRYSMRDMAAKFPVLISLDALCHDSPNIPDSWCRVWPKIFQTEAILLWWRAARDNNFVYSNVWVVQDDVEYTGDPGQFLTSDEFRGYDLVTPHAIHPIVKDHTARQITVLSNTDRLWFGSEGVRRYSARLLDVLEQSSKAGESAWSEFSAPTICRQTLCRFTHFPRDVISPRFNWEDNTDGTILTADELADLALNDPAWQDVWVHKVWPNDARKNSKIWGKPGVDHGVSLMLVILIVLASIFAILLGYATGLLQKPSPRRFARCKKLYPGGESAWRRALVAEAKRLRDEEAQKKIDAAKRETSKIKDPEV